MLMTPGSGVTSLFAGELFAEEHARDAGGALEEGRREGPAGRVIALEAVDPPQPRARLPARRWGSAG
jgi:hypothetical protein